jgi:AcrR family transcriptional regulator
VVLRTGSSYDHGMTDSGGTATMSERKRRNPEVRRTQILDAARNCFASFGFQGTSVDRIATEAGVSVGLLYRFFNSKAAIIEAIIIEEVEAQLAQLGQAIDINTLDARATSNLAMRALGEASLDPKRMAMMFEISAEVCRNPKLRTFLRDRHVRAMASLREKLVERGAEEKIAAETVARVDLASAIVSGLGTRALLHSDALSKGTSDEMQVLIDDIFALALDRKRPHSAGR